jgi:hypothetical protein
MSISTKAKSKRRGKPVISRDPIMSFRAAPLLRGSIVRWAENQPDTPTLSEATRRLVEIGLTVQDRQKTQAPARKERAKDLAAEVIDNLTPDTANLEQRTSRKRRLLTGPEEFRDVRVDLTKAKTK